MKVQKQEMGFTIVELVITLVVMALFLTLFFQMFITGKSQQTTIARQAIANDIAISNLNKITSRAAYSGISGTACISGAGSTNNLLDSTLDPVPGSIIASTSSSPSWATAGLAAESTAGTVLAGQTVNQELRVFYTSDCASSNAPVKIQSTVTYENGSETVTHATFVK